MKRSSVPLLKQENIQELNEMVVLIMEKNHVKLEQIYENQITNEKTQTQMNMNEFSFQAMHKVLEEQFHKKQKIIDNMCHFSLSLMNTVDILWQQKEDLQTKIQDLNDQIKKLNQHIYEKHHENQSLKNRLHDADLCIDQLIQEKQKIQQNILKANQFEEELTNFQMLLQHQEKQFGGLKFEKEQKSYFVHEVEEKLQQQNELLQESIIKESIQAIKNSCIDLSIQGDDFLQREQEQNRQQKSKMEKQDKSNQKTKGETEQSSLESKKSQNQNQQSLNVNANIQLKRNPSLNLSVYRNVVDQKIDIFKTQQQMSEQKIIKISNGQQEVQKVKDKDKQKVDIGIGAETQCFQDQHQPINASEYGSCIQRPGQSFQEQIYSRQNSSIWVSESQSCLQPVLTKTKSLQVCLLDKQPIFKPVMKKNVEKKSIAIQASPKLLKKQSLNTAQTQNENSIMSFLNKSFSMSELKVNQEKTLKKNEETSSINKLFGYFTNKVVKSRIKINKKNTQNPNLILDSSSKLQKSSILSINDKQPFKKMVK